MSFILLVSILLLGCGATEDDAVVASVVDDLKESGIYRIKPVEPLTIDVWQEDEQLLYADVERSTKSVAAETLPDDFWMEIQPYTLDLAEGDQVEVELDGVDEIHTIIKHVGSQQFFSPHYNFQAGSTGSYVLIVFPLNLSRWSNEINYDIIVRVNDTDTE